VGKIAPCIAAAWARRVGDFAHASDTEHRAFAHPTEL